MSFMSSVPSLSGTMYTDHDVIEARRVWEDIEKRYVPGWFASPTGYLAPLFQSNSLRAAYVLIDVAAALYILGRNITERSVPVFEGKVRSLLTEKAFDELLTEIMVAAELSKSVNPIAFEPYVVNRQTEGDIARFLRNITKTTGKQLASPDYAVVLPDGVVAIEVTVLYIGQLQKWQSRVNEIRDVLRAKILAAEGIYRDVDLELPLEFNSGLGNKLCERRVTNEIMRKKQGELDVAVGQEIARLRWRPMLIYERSTFDMHNVPAEVNTFAVTESGTVARNGFEFTSRPTGNRQRFEELMYKSLIDTLARKRDQFRGKNDRYILILKRGHHRMPSELLHDLFRRRIWPNSVYHWITCFGEFQPRRDHTKGSSGHSLTFQINPNAEPSTGSYLTSLLSNEKTFHTDKGSIKVNSHRGEPVSPPVQYPSPLGGFIGKLTVWISRLRYACNVLMRKH